jgi:hypothetical protein
MAALPPSSDGRHAPSTANPTPNNLERGYSLVSNSRPSYLAAGSAATDFGSMAGKPTEASPLSQDTMQQHSHFNEEWDASQRASSVLDGPKLQRSNSTTSQGETLIPSRGGTLKKKASLKRGNSFKRSGSRRSSRAGSVRSLALEPEGDEMRSAFYSPVPTSGNPTEILANRFNGTSSPELVTFFQSFKF